MKINNKMIEEMFEAYKRSKQGNGDLSRIVLGDEVYEKRFKMPKWNIMPNMLMEPKIAIRYNTSIGIPTSKEAHRHRAITYKGLQGMFETAYGKLVDAAHAAHGEGDGRYISGIIRSHFPEGVKDRLRFLAHGKSMLSDAVRLHENLSKTRSPLFT